MPLDDSAPAPRWARSGSTRRREITGLSPQTVHRDAALPAPATGLLAASLGWARGPARSPARPHPVYSERAGPPGTSHFIIRGSCPPEPRRHAQPGSACRGVQPAHPPSAGMADEARALPYTKQGTAPANDAEIPPSPKTRPPPLCRPPRAPALSPPRSAPAQPPLRPRSAHRRHRRCRNRRPGLRLRTAPPCPRRPERTPRATPRGGGGGGGGGSARRVGRRGRRVPS